MSIDNLKLDVNELREYLFSKNEAALHAHFWFITIAASSNGFLSSESLDKYLTLYPNQADCVLSMLGTSKNYVHAKGGWIIPFVVKQIEDKAALSKKRTEASKKRWSNQSKTVD